MKKYRILQIMDSFYPQEKAWCGWVYLDKNVARKSHPLSKIGFSYCASIIEAEEVIRKRIEYSKINKDSVIVHEYKQQENEK
jgi:hypothetical protein